MKPPQSEDAKRAYIEELGLIYEQSGMQRMAGRVLAALLVAEPAEQTADELAGTLQASRGSISSATRYLIQQGFIERMAKPGERRDYYRNKPGAWITMMRRGTEQFRTFKEMAERGLNLLHSDDTEVPRGLKEMRDFYAVVERDLPEIFAKWEQELNQKT